MVATWSPPRGRQVVIALRRPTTLGRDTVFQQAGLAGPDRDEHAGVRRSHLCVLGYATESHESELDFLVEDLKLGGVLVQPVPLLAAHFVCNAQTFEALDRGQDRWPSEVELFDRL